MKLILFFLLLAFSQLPLGHCQETLQIKKVLKVEINSSINPATYNYIKTALTRAHKESFELLLITMNTPGGLVSTTKDILTAFGESEVPIAVWIRPEGASATSAGAIISSGAHLLYMSEGTNIGAAAPVMMGKDIDPKKIPIPGDRSKKSKDEIEESLKQASDMKKKAVNDLVALVSGLAEARGRNISRYADMISKASSFSANEAKKDKTIDGIANTEEELWQKINGRTIRIKGKEFKLSVTTPNVVTKKMDLGQMLLNIFANPSLAYLLFLAGAALLYFELQAPGGFIAGSIGAILLLLAGIGFQVLPLNMGALGLIILAFILFIVETYVASFGLISIAGIVSLFFGSLFLFRTTEGEVEIPTMLIYASSGSVALFLLFLGVFLFKDYDKKNDMGALYDMPGKRGKVMAVKGPNNYSVKISGELWNANSQAELHPSDEIEVVAHNSETMHLEIKKI
jgi:membrane-bound serine protease (ClpP class)